MALRDLRGVLCSGLTAGVEDSQAEVPEVAEAEGPPQDGAQAVVEAIGAAVARTVHEVVRDTLQPPLQRLLGQAEERRGVLDVAGADQRRAPLQEPLGGVRARGQRPAGRREAALAGLAFVLERADRQLDPRVATRESPIGRSWIRSRSRV